ncbi:unnamed protein product [Didymodactylos carnosus]|uniref:Diphthine methyl ester synthase n=1 Tax=Didymodactylos carnosus TaxID=1234261 RepID=A0A815X3L7_9BILA|nr:unnamed protein product [Didymodactylos carnosus]CAF4413952.1 unnamed protein product [Didymodactylos carnosus]
MAKSKRSKWCRAMRSAKRTKLSNKDELKRQLLTSLKMDDENSELSLLKPAVPSTKNSQDDVEKIVNDSKEGMQIENDSVPSKYNKKTLKDEHGQYPSWLNGRQRKRFQAKNVKKIKKKPLTGTKTKNTKTIKKNLILENAKVNDVAFLVGGDPLSATTHTDLILRAVELNIPYKIIHNASIMNAIGSCGLQLYHFGETVSIVFWTDNWKPTSFCDKIIDNRRRKLHTLCLLGNY